MNPLSSKAHSLAQTRQTKHRTNRTENQHERATKRIFWRFWRPSFGHAQTLFSSVERDMSNNVDSINDSRINVKKCASRNGLKLRSANTARSMRCNTAVQDRGRRLNQSQ